MQALRLGLATVAALISIGCGDVAIQSAYRDQPITVDGRFDDWRGRTQFIEKIDVSVGAVNDDTDLYVILVIGDRETQRRIMMSGLYLWFDPEGKDDRQFGVHYPLGIKDAADFMTPPERGSMGGDREKLRERFQEESLAEAELIGAGGYAHVTQAVADLPGVEVRAREERGAMVIEYRIPLAADVEDTFGVGAPPGCTVGVGLVTPEIDMSAMRDNTRAQTGGERPSFPGGGPPGGGMGGRPGGRGGRFEAPEPINLWATLRLAARPSD